VNTAKWKVEIDDITESFKNEFGGLTAEQLNYKPAPDVWSIAQNVHHLIVINESYYPILKAVRENTYKLPLLGRFEFVVNLFGKTILNSVSPDRRRKMKTFPLWQPSKSDLGADILEKFAKHQQQLKDLIDSSSDLLDANTVISSPANRNIVYKLKTAFDIMVTHEKRHLEQARELKSRLPSSKMN
jgi:hypothetical protein